MGVAQNTAGKMFVFITLVAVAFSHLILSGSTESQVPGMVLGDEKSPMTVPCDKLGDTGGERGGEPFDDACGIIKQLIVYTGPCGPVDAALTGLYVVYWNGDVHKHGGNGTEGGHNSNATVIDLRYGGTIVETLVDGGSLVDSIQFGVLYPNNTFRTFGPYGGRGGNWDLIKGCVYGFWGHSVNCINHLGLSGGPQSFCDHRKPPGT